MQRRLATQGSLHRDLSGAHAVVLLDQAGWYVNRKLRVPNNISIVALPAKFPELGRRSVICSSLAVVP